MRRSTKLVLLGVAAFLLYLIGSVGFLRIFLFLLSPVFVAIVVIISLFFVRTKDNKQKQKTSSEQNGQQQNAQQSETKETGKKQKETQEDKSEYGQVAGAIKAMTIAVMGIRNKEVKDHGFQVLKVVKDIAREHYKENNTCRDFSQFVQYYVPTLKKTLENYRLMESKGVITEKIQNDMISYLKSCNEAFTTLYRSMFSDDLMDIEIQMDAMNLTMKRNGLL